MRNIMSFPLSLVGIGILVIVLMGVFGLKTNALQEWVVEVRKFQYDYQYPNRIVKKHAQLDSVLLSLPRVSYYQLPKTFLKATGMDQKPWKTYYQKSIYVVVKEGDLYKYIVGEIRLIDLAPKDQFLTSLIFGFEQQKAVYLLVDPQVLHRLLDLELALEADGYDANALQINHSFRYPNLNAKVNGATQSQHLVGKALDIVVQDINRDGNCDDFDKDILLSNLENHIIGDRGGIGRYPHTHVVHIDVRGKRARWDFHKKIH